MKILKICDIYSAIELLENGKLVGKWLVSILHPADCIENRAVISRYSKCGGVLRLDFDDVIRAEYGSREPRIEDVRRAIEWSRDKEDIVIHCHAGSSRSSAIAYVIECAAVGPDEAVKIFDYRYHSPNELIVELGATFLKDPRISEVYWEWRNKFDTIWVKELYE